MSQAFNPTSFNQLMKSTLEKNTSFRNIMIEGEISNCSLNKGHYYFALKDSESTLPCVMFKNNAEQLNFKLTNGLKVIITGSVSVYTVAGRYQIACTKVQGQGLGDLQIAMDQLMEKLRQEGLFDPCYKKPLPHFPKRILLVTAATGAVVHDMIRILRENSPSTQILVLPVPVQGVNAASQTARAIQWANEQRLGDLMIIGRGGGSKEDLNSYNDEALARSIFQSQIPIISAVGHEPDVSISDYVADVRAATPTHAAEMAVPNTAELKGYLYQVEQQMKQNLLQQLGQHRQTLSYYADSSGFRDPCHLIHEKAQMLFHLEQSLDQGIQSTLQQGRSHCARLSSTLHALSPFEVMSRGYAIPRNKKGTLLQSVEDTQVGDSIVLSLADGSVHCVTEKIDKTLPVPQDETTLQGE